MPVRMFTIHEIPMSLMRRTLVAAIVATAASFGAARPIAAQQTSAQQPAATPPTATFLGYHTTVPRAWTSATPSSSMRLAEYRVPGAAGALPVEVVVYFFGPGQGGPPDANIERWHSQFSNPDGTPVKALVRRDSAGKLPVTFAEFTGTYARGVGTGSSADAARPGHTLLAAIVETPRGTLFVQCYGPSAAVTAQRAAYEAFVKGLRE
jgi:hypothetical protein